MGVIDWVHGYSERNWVLLGTKKVRESLVYNSFSTQGDFLL